MVLILVALANLFAATVSPWGSSDPYHFTSNYGRDEDLIRLITPSFSDCLQYIQFVVLAGSLSLKYPGFYQPAASQGSWSMLLFNQSFVDHPSHRPAIADGVYNVSHVETPFGLDRMAQYVGLESGSGIWTGFIIWLLVLIGVAIVISQLFVALRWLAQYATGNRDHDMRFLNLPFTVGNILRIILNFFLLPAIALSLFQLVKARHSTTVAVAFAAILLIVLIGGTGYIMFLIARTRPQSYLFDDLPTVLYFGPLYNTYADESASFFTCFTITLTFVRGIAIGAIQSSGIAQLVLLAVCEVAMVIIILAFRPYAHATHMNVYHSAFAFIRLVTIILSIAFIPALNVSYAVRGWIGYVNLCLHGAVLIFGFFLNAIQTLVEVGLRLCGAGGDDADPTRGGLVNVLGMRQLARRTGHAPHHSIASAAEVLVRPSGQFDPEETTRHSRSLSAGSTLLLSRSNPMLPGVPGDYDPNTSRSRTNSLGPGAALTPSTGSGILPGASSTAATLAAPAASMQPAQRAMGLAALRARDEHGGPFYRPPRAGPLRSWVRKKGGNDGAPVFENTGGDAFSSDPDLYRVSTSGYQAAARDDPDRLTTYTDDGALDAVAGSGVLSGRNSRAARKDYATREADMYYQAREPAFSPGAPRIPRTGPHNPIPTDNGGVVGWFKGLFGAGKTKEQGKGFEVVRSHRALDMEDGELPDDGKGEAYNMSTRSRSPQEAGDDDDDAIRSVHDGHGAPIAAEASKQEVPPSPYSLDTTNLFPEPYHDEPMGTNKQMLQRDFSRSEAGSVRSRPTRQTSAAGAAAPRGSTLHEADEDIGVATDPYDIKPPLLADLSLNDTTYNTIEDDRPSRSPVPVLPNVEQVGSIDMPSRWNSVTSGKTRSTLTSPSIKLVPSRLSTASQVVGNPGRPLSQVAESEAGAAPPSQGPQNSDHYGGTRSPRQSVDMTNNQGWVTSPYSYDTHTRYGSSSGHYRRPRSAEPVGGVARFQTLVDHYRNDPIYEEQPGVLTFFSGDVFNPSIESSVTKGRHMVPFVNLIGTNVACLGNHDIDFGIAQFNHLREQCDFPWLLANVIDHDLGPDVPMCGLQKTCLLTASNGLKVGVVGLIEKEWLETVNILPPNIEFLDVVETAESLAPQLREQGADIVVAVTHQREPNDKRLAEETTPGLIDIILGGHDHFYSHAVINRTHVLRSGTDFCQLSYIEAWRKQAGDGWDFRVIRRDVVRAIPEQPAAKALVDELGKSMQAKLEKPIGYTAVPLDARFSTVRQVESNYGNFVTDVMRDYYDGDCCIIASGTIRGDQVYAPGTLRVKDILNCFPFEDGTIVVRVTGKAIRGALENGVSNLPALEGRFPQVSNITFSYDLRLPTGHRVVDAKIGGQDIEDDRVYRLVTRGYMGRGKDGFDSLLVKSEGGQAEEIVSEEEGLLISTILRQYFLSAKVVGAWDKLTSMMTKKWRSINDHLQRQGSTRAPRPRLQKGPSTKRRKRHFRYESRSHVELPQHMDSESEGEDDREQAVVHGNYVTHNAKDLVDAHLREMLARKYVRRWIKRADIDLSRVTLADDVDDEELPTWTVPISPRVEGRITRLG
ncbi:hypothetical protein KEM52_005773 [Ascosphaera acerosa]|nr:hypothetical protein KEM52_005773 [Ascosphaera acerosa]